MQNEEFFSNQFILDKKEGNSSNDIRTATFATPTSKSSMFNNMNVVNK